MKAIALPKESSVVELIDIPQPVPASGGVGVRIIRCGLCGTDREIIRRGSALCDALGLDTVSAAWLAFGPESPSRAPPPAPVPRDLGYG